MGKNVLLFPLMARLINVMLWSRLSISQHFLLPLFRPPESQQFSPQMTWWSIIKWRFQSLQKDKNVIVAYFYWLVCGSLKILREGFKKRKMVEYSQFFWKSSVKTVKNLFFYFYLTVVIFTHMYIPHRRSRWIDNYLSLWDLLKIFLFRVLVNEIIWTGWVLALSHLMVCPYLELINSR